jgi:hypothetical protein
VEQKQAREAARCCDGRFNFVGGSAHRTENSYCRYFKMKVDDTVEQNIDKKSSEFSFGSNSYVNIADHMEHM